MSEFNIWEGEQVRLRALEPGDAERFHEFDQDTESARNGARIELPRSLEGAKQWIEETSRRNGQDDSFYFVIETLERGELVGSINTFNCNRRSGTFSYGIGVGREYSGHGYAKEAIRLVLRFFFCELNYQKVNVGVYSFNDRSLQMHLAVGFQQEGRLRRMVYSDGQHHDVLMLGMTREEFDQQVFPELRQLTHSA